MIERGFTNPPDELRQSHVLPNAARLPIESDRPLTRPLPKETDQSPTHPAAEFVRRKAATTPSDTAPEAQEPQATDVSSERIKEILARVDKLLEREGIGRPSYRGSTEPNEATPDTETNAREPGPVEPAQPVPKLWTPKERVGDIYISPPSQSTKFRVRQAAEHVLRASAEAAQDAGVPLTSMDRLKDFSDDEPVYSTNDGEVSPNRVEAATPEEYYETIKAYYELLKTTGLNPTDLDAIGQIVEHEKAHGEAYQALGASPEDTMYGLWIMQRPASTLTPEEPRDGYAAKLAVMPYTYTRSVSSTKLGLAAAVAAPTDPSQGDRAILQGMGYAGPEDVARRVIAHNERSSHILPVPLPWLRPQL